MILGLGCHVGTWAAQDPPSTALGAAFPTLQPCWKAGKLAMFSREVRSWIFMYNVLILLLATFFFSKETSVRIKSPQQCAGISLQSLQVLISFPELVQGGQRGI